MSLSNSFDFTLSRDALIKRAMLMMGVISSSQTPTSDEISSASDALNLMLKAWQADGIQLWTVTNESVTPVQGREVYTMGPSGNITTTAKPVEVLEVYRRDTSDRIDVPMTRLGRDEYWSLSDKDTEGTPVNFYFEPQQGTQNKFYKIGRAHV